MIAASVAEFLAAETNGPVLERLRAAGVNTEEPGAAGAAGGGSRGGRRPGARRWPGKTVVVTGAVPGYTREGAEEAIMARGGKSPGQRVEEDVRARRRGRARGQQDQEGRGAGRPDVDASGFDALLETGELPG